MTEMMIRRNAVLPTTGRECVTCFDVAQARSIADDSCRVALDVEYATGWAIGACRGCGKPTGHHWLALAPGGEKEGEEK